LSDPESGAHVAAELGELYGRAPTEEVPLGTACETILGVSEIYGNIINIGKMGGKFRFSHMFRLFWLLVDHDSYFQDMFNE